MPDLFMVFDVESVGLHGEAFAVGYVVVDRQGKELDAGRFSCNPERAMGFPGGHAWVQEHIGDRLEPHTDLDTTSVREAFWAKWLTWHEKYAVLVADCAWPVEARFLAACIDNVPAWREWEGPYPLYDVSTAMLMAGRNPLATYERLPNELPEHDPLADARQSARLWLECLPKQPAPEQLAPDGYPYEEGGS